jgi:lysophospholipase L1-like esterase
MGINVPNIETTIINDPYYLDRESQFVIIARTETLNQIVFLGDSITDRCEWNELFPANNVINRGISGDRTYGVLNRLDNIIKNKPSKVFLMIGINDLREGRNVVEVKNDYNKILKQLTENLPNTKIFVQSVLPVDTKQPTPKIKSNDSISNLNKEIKQLTEEYGLTYIDLFSVMADTSGQLKPEFTHDGIHLSGNGYKVWNEAIKPYI